jgi:hypothetical protein
MSLIGPSLFFSRSAIEGAADGRGNRSIAIDGVDGPRRHHQCQTGGVDSQPAKGPSMAKISMIGIDLAKNVFQIHGIDAAGTVGAATSAAAWADGEVFRSTAADGCGD